MVFRKIRWAIEYSAVMCLAWGLRVLPLGFRLAVGRLLGRTAFLLDRRHRKVALDNLAMAYPESEAPFRKMTARQAFEHLGRLLVEITCQKCDVRGVLPMTRIEGWHYLQEAAIEGKGYFLVSAHFGNWERVAHLQAAMGYDLWMVTRPLDNPYLERFFAGVRENTGNKVVHKRNAVREMVRGIRKGKGIAFVIDQNFGEAGRVFVPYFGKLAATTPALGRLAVRLKVPVLPVFAFPEINGVYRVVYGPPVEVPDTGLPEADGLELTRRLTARVEEAVRECPGAWFWMHRRWKTRPEGEAPRNGSDGDGEEVEGGAGND